MKGKKTERQKARDYADMWFSRYIRAKDYPQGCYTCGSREYLQCGHLITRSKFSTRWEPLNAKTQCRSCNKRHEHQPEIFTTKWIKEYGEDAYHELVRMSNKPKKFTTQEIRELGDFYRSAAELIKESCPNAY